MTNEKDVGGAIRTPDQRLRVFISSTLAELAEERVAVSRAISALRLTPVMFELGARPHPPRELYRAYLAQSEIFIGLYWQRYGWVGPDMDISGLEDEFRLSGSMPRLMYVKIPAPAQEPRLTAMIKEVEGQGTSSYRTFSTSRELGRLVRDDLALLLSERFAAPAQPAGGRSAAVQQEATQRPRSLPVTSTSLIGRAPDIAEVVRLLEAPEVRLVTLSGPGGIGKTRLAIAAAEQMDQRYPQGAVFVPLASITLPELVLPRIAAAVGATIEGARSPLDVVAEHLADTATLLVLDNLEQVVSVASDLDQLLGRCPGLKILATSRSVLRLRAEREYAVSPLTVPSLSDSLAIDQLSRLPAVQLFVDRAQAVRHGFRLTGDNAQAVVQICQRLDGLPLAIELAAARTRLLEPKALLARLESRLDVLGAGPVDLPERQRTLRATVEWSLGLLDEEQQQMLAAMSVFVDGWTVEVATHVAGRAEDRTLDLLDALAGHSLVRVEATDVGARFSMLSSIREVAAERLAASASRAEIEKRHAQYFAGLVENADWPVERQAEWAARIRTEEGNLGAAIRWFLAHDIAPLPHIFRILWLFWQMRDRMPEGKAWIHELVSRSDSLDDGARAELLFISAVTAVEVGDDQSAQKAVEGLKRLEGRIEDPHLQSAAHLAVSWAMPGGDDLEEALRSAATALGGLREQNQPLMGWAALTVGLLEMTLGRPEAALASLTEASNLGGQFGNHWLESAARTQLASLAVNAGQLDQARALLAASVHAGGEAELSTQSMTFALVAWARLALAEGQAGRAATALGAAEAMRKRAGLRAWPSMRGEEARLRERVAQELGPEAFKAALNAAGQLGRREAVALVRGEGPTRPA